MVRKIYFYTLILCLFIFSGKTFGVTVDDIINSNSQFSSAIIAISVKDLNTGKIIYQKNPKMRVHPASTLKIITSPVAFNILGENYKFKTLLAKSDDDIYLKVGADPLFTVEDMKKLIKHYKDKNLGEINKIIIDDTIIDKVPFGIGWQWDDNTEKFFPQVSPYIVNQNIMKINVSIDSSNHVCLDYSRDYSEQLLNQLKYGDSNNISIYRNIFAQKSPIILSGTVNTNKTLYIPVKYPEEMYKFIFTHNFGINRTQFGQFPKNSNIESEISHNIIGVLERINTNSDNLAAEILLKHAAAKSTNSIGTTVNGVKLVKDFYTQNGINMNDITIVDASGVSMNDYVTADFMTNALIAISKNTKFPLIKNSMSDNAKGSFSNRLPELNGRIKVKTGTLANTSAVVGYLKTTNNNEVVFAIILDNIQANVNAKNFENQIIKAIAD